MPPRVPSGSGPCRLRSPDSPLTRPASPLGPQPPSENTQRGLKYFHHQTLAAGNHSRECFRRNFVLKRFSCLRRSVGARQPFEMTTEQSFQHTFKQALLQISYPLLAAGQRTTRCRRPVRETSDRRFPWKQKPTH